MKEEDRKSQFLGMVKATECRTFIHEEDCFTFPWLIAVSKYTKLVLRGIITKDSTDIPVKNVS